MFGGPVAAEHRHVASVLVVESSTATFTRVRLTGDTVLIMEAVTVRELRNHGGEVLDRVARGERLSVTRDGVEVAELRPRVRRSPAPADLVARRRSLPPVDPDQWRHDVDEVLDPSL